MGTILTCLDWYRRQQRIDTGVVTLSRSVNQPVSGVGGSRYDPEYSTTSYVEWLTVARGYQYNDELDMLDSYIVDGCTLQITTGERGLTADTEIVVMPDYSGVMSDAQNYEALKTSPTLAKTGEARAASTTFDVSITDTTVVRKLITNGIGFRREADEWGSITKADIIITYGLPLFDVTLSAVYPSSKIVVGNNAVTFSWALLGNALPQSHYDLQYSGDGITWTTVADKVESAATSHIIPGGTFEAGAYVWRVRVYASDGTTATNWVQAPFTVRLNAETSGVVCDNSPMPTVTWTAVDQQAYQVRIGDYDSGTVYSTEGSHRPAEYFADGAYPVTVRTQSDTGLWSAWTDPLYAELRNTPSADIILTVYQDGYGAALRWATDGSYTDYYVLRDGVPIAKTDATEYKDELAYGTHTYVILAPHYGGYTTSGTGAYRAALPFDMISPVDNIAWLPLKYSLGGLMTRGYSDSEAVSYRYFAGRDYPVAFVSGQKARKASLRYAFKSPADAAAICALLGCEVVFKDRRGNRVIGVLDSVNRTVGKLNDMTLNITQTDYNERVEYDTEPIVG